MIRVFKPRNTIFSQKSRITLGVATTDVPAGTVDFTISGEFIDTINATLTSAQCVAGYAFSFFANASNHGFKPFDITISGVGYDDVVITAYLTQDTEVVTTNWTPHLTLIDGVCNWLRELPTFTNVSTKRQSVKDDVFIDTAGVVPSGAPYNITTGAAAANGITLNNANSGTKINLEFRENDHQGYYWTSSVGWSENSTPSDILVIDHLGHGEPGHDLMYNAIMDAGYDYANCALPDQTNNPNITESFPVTKHNQMQTVLGTSSYDIRRLFMFDKIRALDYILSQKSYTTIILTGVSGGGAMATLWGAIDSRINKTFCFRGTSIQAFQGGDAEQGPTTRTDYLSNGTSGALISASYRKNTRLDLMALCASNGACHLVNHITDTCCWYGYYNDIFEERLIAKAIELGGSYAAHSFTSGATALHGYHTDDDIAYLLANI